MVHKYVPFQALLLALLVVALELASASHFKGAIIQWRPVDPVNFDGRVSAWLGTKRMWCKENTHNTALLDISPADL